MQKMPAPLRFIPPMECLEVDQIPEGDLWQYELKLDGYRTIAIKQDGDVHLFSRNGTSFNSKFPSVVQALETIRIKRFMLDGEVVALDERGRHSFALLQKIKLLRRHYAFTFSICCTSTMRPSRERFWRSVETNWRMNSQRVPRRCSCHQFCPVSLAMSWPT